MRLFLDANVLFSAAHREAGSMRVFFRLADVGACELISSPYTIGEARRNIARKYPKRSGDLELLVARLVVCTEASAANVSWAAAQPLPAEDAPILAAAVQAEANILATGDKTDFGHLFGRTLRGTEVLTPIAAIERITAGDIGV